MMIMLVLLAIKMATISKRGQREGWDNEINLWV